MSIEAVAYVVNLIQAPNGEPLTRDEKAVLYPLADAHNAQNRVTFPSVPKIALLSLMSERHAREQLRSLERKQVIATIPPQKIGRGYFPRYVFCELDSHSNSEKGAQCAPFLSGEKGAGRGHSGPKKGAGRGQEGGTVAYRNKEEPRTKNHKNLEPKPSLPKGSGEFPDPRHAPVREAIQRLQKTLLGYEIWDASAAARLADLLKRVPGATAKDLIECAVFRAMSSDLPFSDHPRRWLGSLPSYQSGPLDRYGRYQQASGAEIGGRGFEEYFERLSMLAFGVEREVAS